MTYKLIADFTSSLPIQKPLSYQPVKLYSLFKKDTNGRWIRVSNCAYSEKFAYRVFAERLLDNPLEMIIKPIKIESLGAK